MSSGPHWCEAQGHSCPPEELLIYASKGGASYEGIRLLLQLPQFSALLPKPPVENKRSPLRCYGFGPVLRASEERQDAACNCRRLLKSLVMDDNPLPPSH